ncbi:MAG: ATPase [Bacteroidetes bacterium GWA2_31_9]|nr:MAG: ATPase [Bacteroidetes bacterium GWA2_31_9]
MIENIIEIQSLSKSFGEVKALKDITLNIQENELFGIIGPDGAGKTTLFRVISTLLLPESGSVTVKGLDVVRNYNEIRKIIGYMAGRFSLYQDLSVEENLEFYATVFGVTIKENYHLIKDIYSHIEPFKKRLAGKLSGGMKQKLALSCALIHYPKILILDEPTTGVDAVSRKEFWEMLKALKSYGITIVVSTPYMDEAVLCDRVALMQGGQILKIDKPQNIISQYSKKLFSVRSENMYGLLQDLRKIDSQNKVFLFGQYIHYTDETGKIEISFLENYLKENNHNDVEIKLIEANIEDCFMDLMLNKVEND